MTTHSITVELSPSLLHRLQQAAKSLDRSVEEIIEQSIQGNLPPALSDVPAALQQEVDMLQRADRDTLWRIAQETLPAEQWARHEILLERNQDGELAESELEELSQLRQRADLLMLRRSYVLALLKWRGYSLPLQAMGEA